MSSNTGWIISLIVLVVAICAGLAALGFKGRISTVGVDLGTTFSVVGINNNGKIEIVTDKAGRNIFPSVISYGDNGEIWAGYDAVARMSTHSQNTIYNAKRFIGRSLSETDVQQYANEHPFEVVESLHISNYSQVGFRIDATGHNPIISPEQVGTQVLRFLMKLTADYLGHNQVNKAVIAVPAKFSPLQRQATGEAYKKAGLKVVRVMEEPTAAAVAYRLHKRTDIHHILVYDFGGGTLDVSLLYVAKGSVEVYATDGDETLGGSDMDLCLYRIIKNRITTLSDVIIADHSTSATSSSSNDNACEGPAIHKQAEAIKKQLTSSEEAEFICQLPDNGSVSFTVTRQDFEDGCSDLFQRSMLPVTRLLDSLGMDKSDVDEVVLVGGSTRMPKVKQQLREFFNKDKLNDQIDPDVTVAYGAASILD